MAPNDKDDKKSELTLPIFFDAKNIEETIKQFERLKTIIDAATESAQRLAKAVKEIGK